MGERHSAKSFRWKWECDGVSCLPFSEYTSNFLETRAAGNDNVSVEFPKDILPPFGKDVALNNYFKFSDYLLCRQIGNRAESTIAQLAFPNDWIVNLISHFTEQERRGGHWQKMHANTYASYMTTISRRSEGRARSFQMS